MVTSESAILDIPEETIAPILSNHCDMGKYSSFDDPNYAHVRFCLRKLMELTSLDRRSSVESEESGPSGWNSPRRSTQTGSVINSERTGAASVNASDSPLPQSPTVIINRHPVFSSESMTEEDFAAIVRDGDLASIDSAIDTAIELNEGQVI